jgi:hypothetical protein
LLLLLWQGKLHRDLKLSNAILDLRSGIIRLADLGLMEPIGSPLTCYSADAPHIDYCRAAVRGQSGDPATIAALNRPALDTRQLFLSALFGGVGAKNLPVQVNWLYNHPFPAYVTAVANFDWAGYIYRVIAPQCPATAHLLCSVLGPLDQAAVPSIAELLQHPLLAPMVAEAQALFAAQRGAYREQHLAAYWGGLELKELLEGLPSALTSSTSSSRSSNVFFTRQFRALQDSHTAAEAAQTADSQGDLPAGVGFDLCEIALAATAALQGGRCDWNHAHLQDAERQALQQQQQEQSPAVGSACSTPAESPTPALQHRSAASAVLLLPVGAWRAEALEAHEASSSSSTGGSMSPVATAACASLSPLPAGALRLADLEARLWHEAISSMPPPAGSSGSLPPLPVGALRLAEVEAQLWQGL